MTVRPDATLITALVLALTAAGCAGGTGAKRYGCDGLPSRPLCLSTAEIYHLTEHAGPPPAELPPPEGRAR